MIAGVGSNPAGPGAIDIQTTPASGNFTATLKQTLEEITRLQAQADQKVAGMATGNGEDLPTTMIAVEQANVAFELMVEVRNKIVQAYQEVSQMAF
jgi:flagellar hook-basal body complex protein FliE